MKTKLTFFLLLWATVVFSQTPDIKYANNTLTVIYTWDQLGLNYHRNITPYFGIAATARIAYDAAAYDYRSTRFDPFEFPEGNFVYLNEYAFRPSIATAQPDFIHPNGNHFGARTVWTSALGGIGFFGEKRELIFKRMNFKVTTFVSMLRMSLVQEQGGVVGLTLPVGPNGEESFKFTYFHNHYEQYWTKPFVSFDFQLDWRVYKRLHLGILIIYYPTSFSAQVYMPYGGFTFATRF
jgi:hypothetical protein